MIKMKTTLKDGLGILHNRFYAGKPERLAGLEEMRAADDVALEPAPHESLRPLGGSLLLQYARYTQPRLRQLSAPIVVL